MNIKTIVPVAITSLVFVAGIACFVAGMHYANGQNAKTLNQIKSTVSK